MKRVFICSGGPIEEVVEVKQLPFSMEETIFIGADRGAIHLVNQGIVPNEIIGDFDSLVDGELELLREKIPHITILPAEKDETDTHLALREAMKYKPEEVYVTGISGGRLDHYEAALHDVCGFQQANPEVRFFIQNKQNKLQFFLPGTHILENDPAYKYVSFFAFAREIENISLDGFLYNVEKETIQIGNGRFTSNQQVGRTSHISFDTGICLMIRSSD